MSGEELAALRARLVDLRDRGRILHSAPRGGGGVGVGVGVGGSGGVGGCVARTQAGPCRPGASAGTAATPPGRDAIARPAIEKLERIDPLLVNSRGLGFTAKIDLKSG